MIHGFDNAGQEAGELPRYYDTQDYIDSFWKMAEALEAPIYLHPRSPAHGMELPYEVKYPELSMSAYGFQQRLADQILMLILGGVFDHCPKLQVVVGHMGEGIPWSASRIDERLRGSGKLPLEHTNL